MPENLLPIAAGKKLVRSDEEGQGHLIRWDGLAAGPGVYHGSSAFQKAGKSLNTGPRKMPLSAYKKRRVASQAVTTGPRKYDLSNQCESAFTGEGGCLATPPGEGGRADCCGMLGLEGGRGPEGGKSVCR